MTPSLPESLEHLLRPLFDQRPIAMGMDELVISAAPADDQLIHQVQTILDEPGLKTRLGLAAGLWLYIGQLDRAHKTVRSLETPIGSFWHAIMHRREGDFANSHYWYRRTGHHPAMSRIDVAGGGAGSGTDVGAYDPHDFVERVERAHQRGESGHPELLTLQRREWAVLFECCARM